MTSFCSGVWFWLALLLWCYAAGWAHYQLYFCDLVCMSCQSRCGTLFFYDELTSYFCVWYRRYLLTNQVAHFQILLVFLLFAIAKIPSSCCVYHVCARLSFLLQNTQPNSWWYYFIWRHYPLKLDKNTPSYKITLKTLVGYIPFLYYYSDSWYLVCPFIYG